MAINRSQLRKQLEPGLNTVFGLEYKRYEEEWRRIFAIENSNRAYEEDQLMTGFGAAAVKAEGAGVQYDEAMEGYTSRYNHTTIALAFSITEEAQDDNLYGDIGRKLARALARSMQFTKEVRGADILNNGFNPAFTGGDGVELFATNHPLQGGGTFSNELATPADLSETALEDACIAISRFKDDRGIPVKVMPKSLIIPNELKFEAHRILRSDLRVGTGDNDTNALKDMGMFQGGVHVNRFLTDVDAWFIVTDCQDGLKHMIRKGIATKTEGEFNTGNIRYKSSERYSFGWTDPRGAFASGGA